MIEAQIRYVMSCLKLIEGRRAQVIDLRPEAQARFGTMLRERMAHTVWQAGGCRSWYQDSETGDNVALWPGSVPEYRWKTRRVRPADYTIR